MATLVIRNIENSLHTQLKEYAAARGHSMEEEVRLILRERLRATPPEEASSRWVDAIRSLFEPIGGLDLPEIAREPLQDPPDFTEVKLREESQGRPPSGRRGPADRGHCSGARG
jgi:plasmid stability protein